MVSYFTDYKISKRVIHIKDRLGMFSSLILGRNEAVLFDTASGTGDLKRHIADITDLPVTVINSHGHFDHVGGNYQFKEILIHPEDMKLAEKHSSPEIRRMLKKQLNAEETVEINTENIKLKPLKEDSIFDLGGTTLTAVHLPGHTGGSCGLLLMEENLLLSGDAATPVMCMFFPESCNMSVYMETLQYMKKLPFKNFITGHHDILFPKERINSFISCAEHIDISKSMRFQYSFMPQYKGLLYVDGTENSEDPDFTAIIYNQDKL